MQEIHQNKGGLGKKNTLQIPNPSARSLTFYQPKEEKKPTSTIDQWKSTSEMREMGIDELIRI